MSTTTAAAPTTKTRVGVILREKIGVSKGSTTSTDLAVSMERYNNWCKRMRLIIHALEKHHAAMTQMFESRTLVARGLATMSQNTPLWTATGMVSGEDKSSGSYASIHEALSNQTKTFGLKYKQFVLDYAVEWEKIVRSRVDADVKKTEDLRREFDHYRVKVEDLRTTTTRNMAKGKQLKQDFQDKLKRNEDKLVTARGCYTKASTDLCLLIEEITERSWRDLHPLTLKVAQFDMTLASEESEALANLSQVVSKLKEVGDKHGISPQARLKDIAEMNPALLSTRGDAEGTLSIESFNASQPAVTKSHDDMACLPGTVAPQGMGGFPVRVADTSRFPATFPPRSSPVGDSRHRLDSFSSHNSDPLTPMGMLTISKSSAPPPTMDDIYALNATQSVDGSLHSSYSAPPLPVAAPFGGYTGSGTIDYPTARRSNSLVVHQFSRSSSQVSANDDAGSVYSNLSAGGNSSSFYVPPLNVQPPPPLVPPPPPPMSPAANYGNAMVPVTTPTYGGPSSYGGTSSYYGQPSGFATPTAYNPQFQTPPPYDPPPVSAGGNNAKNPFD